MQRRFESFAKLVILFCAILIVTGAGDDPARFDDLGHRMICTCGCNQILLECNHVGCPKSDGMRQELMAAIERGDSDSLVLQAFVQKYGPAVLAAPTTSGFNRVAWIMPFLVFALGTLGAATLVRNWKLRPAAAPASPSEGVMQYRERIRRETDL